MTRKESYYCPLLAILHDGTGFDDIYVDESPIGSKDDWRADLIEEARLRMIEYNTDDRTGKPDDEFFDEFFEGKEVHDGPTAYNGVSKYYRGYIFVTFDSISDWLNNKGLLISFGSFTTSQKDAEYVKAQLADFMLRCNSIQYKFIESGQLWVDIKPDINEQPAFHGDMKYDRETYDHNYMSNKPTLVSPILQE